jgi:hypothetical protein
MVELRREVILDPIRLDAELRAAINSVYRVLGDISYEDIVAAFEQIGARLLPQVESTPELALEVKRRVAEGILAAVIEYRRPLRECIAVVERLEALGWANLHRKTIELGAAASYCGTKRRKDLGRRYIEPLISELEAASSGDSSFGESLAYARRIRARLEPKKPAG